MTAKQQSWAHNLCVSSGTTGVHEVSEWSLCAPGAAIPTSASDNGVAKTTQAAVPAAHAMPLNMYF